MRTRIKALLELTNSMMSEVSVDSDREPMKAYMKGHFEFYGVKSPARKQVLKSIKLEIKDLTASDIFTFVEELWKHNKRESQYLALDILENKKKLWTVEYLPRVKTLITSKSWWDTVDGLAPNIAGRIFSQDFDAKMKWITK